ncbi:MAG: glucose-6-phosphate isomerase [Nocardioidaceae bacterium]|nr:glucose-6-phosphate isomerase [Nocardioidaceae bacterium]
MSESVRVRISGIDVTDVVAQLVDDTVASQVAAQRPTLWGAEAEPEASKRLGWVAASEVSRPLVAEIEALRAELREDGVDSVVLCGMGGSSLAPEVITRSSGAGLVLLDSTEPTVVARALGGDLRRTVVVVSSKSGSTLETDSQRRAFVAAFTKAGIDAASRIVVVTDPDSELHQLATLEGYHVFLADPSVGGRYSALTAFGLVPSGLAGVDVAALLDDAEAVRPALAEDSSDNPALVLAALLAGDRDRDKVVIADAGSGITGFGAWAEQLLAESTGKEGKGILPVPVEGTDAPDFKTPADDVVRIVLEPANEGARLDDALPTAGVSGLLGGQLLLWETATAVAGRLLGINPFDQPDVESAKQAARGMLDARPEPPAPDFTDGVVELRGAPAGAGDLHGAISTLLDQLPKRGYVAVMAYLDPERDVALIETRRALAERTGRPATFGWGPRFLHSTGQYHKGGPAVGVYIQVSAECPSDQPIPDRPFSFGELIAAQAAGDAQVLADHGRPVLRLHLTDPGSGVRQLLEVLR